MRHMTTVHKCPSAPFCRVLAQAGEMVHLVYLVPIAALETKATLLCHVREVLRRQSRLLRMNWRRDCAAAATALTVPRVFMSAAAAAAAASAGFDFRSNSGNDGRRERE